MKTPAFVCALVLAASLVPAFSVSAIGVDAKRSRVLSEKTSLKADGIDNTRITVTVKDENVANMSGAKVVVTSSRGAVDEIKVEKDVSDGWGKAYFRVNSLKDGDAVLTVTANGTLLNETVILSFKGGLSFPLNVGDLIKIPDDNDVNSLSDTAVYYYGSNGRRYVFPNEKVYYTWYPDFSQVKILPVDQMSLVPIGGNVTYKPASKLVKFQTDTKTYLPAKNGKLRWVKTEEAARGLFGDAWNTVVDDISEAFYVNYTFGDPIEKSNDVSLVVLGTGSPNVNVDKGLANE